MKLNELQPQDGATHNSKRVGRGIGSGKGKTCGSGVKGQKARSGVAIKGFEGGQMPLYQRLPKRGFTNIFAKKYAAVNLGRLQEAVDAKKLDAAKPVDEAALIEAGVITRKRDGVRILGNGDLKAKLALKVSGITASAKEAVEKAGGSVEIVTIERKPVERKKAK